MAQRLRFLPGRFRIDHHSDTRATVPDTWLAMVRSPEGLTVVRSAKADEGGAWLALYSGDTLHDLDTPGMTSALLVPLKDAKVSVFVCSTFQADVVLIPEGKREAAVSALRAAGHQVTD